MYSISIWCRSGRMKHVWECACRIYGAWETHSHTKNGAPKSSFLRVFWTWFRWKFSIITGKKVTANFFNTKALAFPECHKSCLLFLSLMNFFMNFYFFEATFWLSLFVNLFVHTFLFSIQPIAAVKFYVVIMAFFVLDLLILLAWVAIDPLQRKEQRFPLQVRTTTKYPHAKLTISVLHTRSRTVL